MGKLKIINMEDIRAEPVDWLWQPYIPLGKITIVQGDPGDGKTTMMLAIAAAVTNGDALPGGNDAAPASVIFQTAEDGLADTIKPRLQQLGAVCSRVHVIDEEESALSLVDERIERAIVKTGAKLFILDPLQAYLGGSDMHSANGIRPLMKQLSGVAGRTGCAIVVIGHLNKNGGKAQYRGLGSIDIYAAARSVLTVGRIDLDENMRAVVQGKSNLSAPGAPLAFGLGPDGGFSWLGEYDVTLDELLSGKKSGLRPESQFAKAQRLLQAELSTQPVPATRIMEMAAEWGVSQKTLHRAKAEMGVISARRGGQWFWELPITVECEVCDDKPEDGQHGHPGAGNALTIFEKDDDTRAYANPDGQDGHAPVMTAFPESEAG